jgi:hypothetical protein
MDVLPIPDLADDDVPRQHVRDDFVVEECGRLRRGCLPREAEHSAGAYAG